MKDDAMNAEQTLRAKVEQVRLLALYSRLRQLTWWVYSVLYCPQCCCYLWYMSSGDKLPIPVSVDASEIFWIIILIYMVASGNAVIVSAMAVSEHGFTVALLNSFLIVMFPHAWGPLPIPAQISTSFSQTVTFSYWFINACFARLLSTMCQFRSIVSENSLRHHSLCLGHQRNSQKWILTSRMLLGGCVPFTLIPITST